MPTASETMAIRTAVKTDVLFVMYASLPQSQNLGLARPRNCRVAGADDHVDLRAHAPAAGIDARLDGEAGTRQQPAVVMRLVVVHVHAVAVHLFAQAVPGPMDELVAVPRGVDHAATGPVDLEATNVAAVASRLFDERHGGVAARG